MEKIAVKDVDEYIAQFPLEVQKRLVQLRKVIKKAAPMAEECISYQMPAYKQNGVLVYFAAYKSHIGFYPTGSAIANFQEEIKGFKSSKGAVQFSVTEKIPVTLVEAMVKFKVTENETKSLNKKRR